MIGSCPVDPENPVYSFVESATDMNRSKLDRAEVAMKLNLTLSSMCATAAFLIMSCAGLVKSDEPLPAPKISNVVDGVVFEAGNWAPHLAPGAEGNSLGNHRAVVVLDDAIDNQTVMVTIPWRRRDENPAGKSIVVVDLTSDEPVPNAIALRVENGSGDIAFQPNPESKTYAVYYMPWRSTGGYYPRITYPKLASTADPVWERRVRAAYPLNLPRARTTHIQSVNEFHSFFPMEVVATESEAAAFMAHAPDGWALVPEHRDYPVRMRRFLPRHWTERGQTNVFGCRALRGEFLTFQLVLVAGARPITGARVSFDGFPAAFLDTITCFNVGGKNEKGEPFTTDVSVSAGSVQPLWIGLEIPESQSPGVYAGEVTVSTADRGSKVMRVSIDVQPSYVANHGFDSPEFMTRLAWLNSTTGADTDFIIEPYHPVRIDGRSLSILGRTVELSESGLPKQLSSFFTPELTHLADTPQPLLVRPIQLRILIDGQPESLQASAYAVHQEGRGRAAWSVDRRSDRVAVRVDGALEYDGMLDYRIAIKALRDLQLDDIALPISLEPDAAKYMLGLGYRGGRRPRQIDWRWNVENHQEGLWLGSVHAGLQYVLRDGSYVRPLNTNFYQDQPLRLPVSWFNRDRGGIRVETRADAVTAVNYSGERRMTAGEELQFNIRFLLTPFRTIDTKTHFRTRFVHRYVPVDSVVESGGTVVNIHHANEINPYINYPFFNLDQQTAYIEEAHRKGVKVKLYNTIRELSYRAHELFALRSLGDEILNRGKGGGHSWMQEHLEADYHSGWHAWRVDDAAMLNKGTSRWTNYYIEGIAWLAAKQHIDGLYLDDIAFSRETMKRMVSVLHKHRDEVVIDLHSANQFNPRDGHTSSAMLYMEHFPFVTRLWFGEYFENSLSPSWFTHKNGNTLKKQGGLVACGGSAEGPEKTHKKPLAGVNTPGSAKLSYATHIKREPPCQTSISTAFAEISIRLTGLAPSQT